MDLLVLFPLEFLANLPGSTPLKAESTSGSKKRVGADSSNGGAQQLGDEEDVDARGELDVTAKLRFEFAKIPALLALKPN